MRRLETTHVPGETERKGQRIFLVEFGLENAFHEAWIFQWAAPTPLAMVPFSPLCPFWL